MTCDHRFNWDDEKNGQVYCDRCDSFYPVEMAREISDLIGQRESVKFFQCIDIVMMQEKDWEFCSFRDESRDAWVIIFEDHERSPLFYFDEHEARTAFAQFEGNWNCHLFRKEKRKPENNHQVVVTGAAGIGIRTTELLSHAGFDVVSVDEAHEHGCSLLLSDPIEIVAGHHDQIGSIVHEASLPEHRRRHRKKGRNRREY